MREWRCMHALTGVRAQRNLAKRSLWGRAKDASMWMIRNDDNVH